MATTERIGMPLDEFNEAQSQQPFELIDGERIPKLPNVLGHSETIRTLTFALHLYGVQHQIGEAFSETTFIKPENYDRFWVTGSRIPDVMYYTAPRLAEYRSSIPNAKGQPLALVPDFVAEVISPNDKFLEVEAKVVTYREDGVRLIWLLDFEGHNAFIYGANHLHRLHLAGDAILDGEDVIPGFQIVLSSLFE